MNTRILEGIGSTQTTRTTRTDSPLASILAMFGPPPAPAARPVTAPPPSTSIALAARLGDLQRHIAERSSNAAWRQGWNARLNTSKGFESPSRHAGYLIDDHLAPAAVAGDVAGFDGWDAYIREFLTGRECERLSRKEGER